MNVIELLREKVSICQQRHHRAIDANTRMAGAVAADEADRLLLEVIEAKLELARELQKQSATAA
jgi:hypothetical protein